MFFPQTLAKEAQCPVDHIAFSKIWIKHPSLFSNKLNTKEIEKK